MSHELKTPLTVILSAVQAMEFFCRDELSERAMKYLGKIRQNALRQLRMVNNILDLTRIESGAICVEVKNVDIVECTSEIVNSVRSYAGKKDIKISFKAFTDKLFTGLDEKKYERIILNLLSNAIKFTPKGKSIYVSIDKFDDKIHISIKDEGIGIPKDKIHLVFECFRQIDSSFTRSTEGSGIGLALSKLLAKVMGGDIEVHSNEKEGSCFTLILPTFKSCDESCGREFENNLFQSIAAEFSDIDFTKL